MSVSPAASTVTVGDSVRLMATVKDAAGNVLTDRAVTWVSGNPSVATVSATGLVIGVKAGAEQATITAISESVSGSAVITVRLQPVASVTVAPNAHTLLVGDTVRLTATVKDGGGNVLTDRAVTWTSSNPSVATVSTTGLVTGVRANPTSATIIATADSVSGSAAVMVIAPAPVDTLSFTSVEAGAYHTCGRTQAGAAYCWGSNLWGQVGNGSLAYGVRTPQAVVGGLTFDSVSVGGPHACGLAAGGAAHCWGGDAHGALGSGAPAPELCSASDIGQFPCSTVPLTVAGGLSFSAVSAGWDMTCALTANGTAYCWGENSDGTLGIGGDTSSLASCGGSSVVFSSCSRTPLPVAGGLAFATISAGVRHVCGLTVSGAAYCWGDNSAGQLGIGANAAPDVCGSSPCSRTPVAVAGGLAFTSLSVGLFVTCGRATTGSWYCWGSNNYGQLGNGMVGPELCQGTNPCSSVPVVVSGGADFAAVFPGYRHSCAITPSGATSCWGWNAYGQLGDSTTVNSLTPVAVAGGLSFAIVSPYYYHSCGLTTGGVAYCWGDNEWGELGNGTTTMSSVPVRVARQRAATAPVVQLGAVKRRGSAAPPLRLPVP